MSDKSNLLDSNTSELFSAFMNTPTSSELPTFLSALNGSMARVTTSLAFKIFVKSSSNFSLTHSSFDCGQSSCRALSSPHLCISGVFCHISSAWCGITGARILTKTCNVSNKTV